MFTGNEDQEITLSAGHDLTKKYRDNNPGQILGHYFSKKTLNSILMQTESVGARIYYAEGADGTKELVIVGVDTNENDLVQGFVGDRTYKSPPHTGNANSLNS